MTTLLENVNDLESNEELELFYVFRSFIYSGNPEARSYSNEDVLAGRAAEAFAAWAASVMPKLTRCFAAREERSR